MGCLEDNYKTALHMLDRYDIDCVFVEELGNIYFCHIK